jgi:glyoxylase-like metal-dependent hydrolase (beta-lactamase superfamily II)
MEVAPGIHHFDTGPFNWYVIEEGGRLTLVDAGFPGHYSVFRKGIQSLGRELKDVEAILLTHSHADHTGFAERLRKETKAPVFVHSADLSAIGKVLQLPWWGLLSNAWRPYIATMLATAVVNGVFTMPSISNARTFGDGDVLDVPGRPHVLHAPGHTPGEVAFYLPERKVLISGDTLVTRNLITGDLGGPQVTHPLLNDDDKAARRSLDRLREIGRVTMLPGHGKPWTGTMADAVKIARGGGNGRHGGLRVA